MAGAALATNCPVFEHITVDALPDDAFGRADTGSHITIARHFTFRNDANSSATDALALITRAAIRRSLAFGSPELDAAIR